MQTSQLYSNLKGGKPVGDAIPKARAERGQRRVLEELEQVQIKLM